VARLIDGKQVAQGVRDSVARAVGLFGQKHGRPPSLHVVLAGDDPASAVYVRNKEKFAAQVGLQGTVHRLPQSVTEDELLSVVRSLNEDPVVDGILVQFPVPSQVRQSEVLRIIDPAKDVDGLHASNVGKLWSGRAGLVPCTPRGCLRLLDEVGLDLSGKHAVVVGRSNLVGKPVAALLLARDATVTLVHSKTRDLAARCREAEIVIAAVGRAKLLNRSYIAPGATVIDVGMNRDEAGQLCGDVDFADVEPIAGAITPVPGGVGPMTIAMLLENTVIAAEARSAG
jgi:methylenetetrahydrofolate dehydrogenase (NADP+)/methenyltetrahydrofolate cyclohydrolase